MPIPVMTGYVNLKDVPEETIGDKITRRIVVGDKGMIVFWKMKAGAHATRADLAEHHVHQPTPPGISTPTSRSSG